MKHIYISYRRQDTGESYGRIAERLLGYFGSEAILRTDSSYTGEIAPLSAGNYRTYVANAMKQCAVLLLIIGPQWLASSQAGGWSLDHLDDSVRIEIEEALRANVPIVPALVQQANMPTADQLPSSLSLLLEQDQHHDRGKRRPESLLALVSRSGLRVRQDPDFGGDTQRLCEVIENLAGLEATNPRQASGIVGRTLRNVILIVGGALTLHAAVLAFVAVQSQLTRTPRFVIPADWLSGVITTGIIDWGIYFLAGYFTARRTGQAGLGIIVSVVSYVIGATAGVAIFVDVTWSKWQLLTTPSPVPAPLVGAPDWLLGPLTLLMQPFLLTFAALALGIPIGLIASVVLGWLGGKAGVGVLEFVANRERERQRETLMQGEAQLDEWSLRQLGVAIFRRRTPSHPRSSHLMPAGKIFISYRRDDSAVMCGAIYDRLVQVFGADTIFKDVDMIPIGVNFERFITTTLEQCVAQLVVIGPRWVSIKSNQGGRRLDDPMDLVRIEVESGLRSGLTVIPVLVQGAAPPPPEELPESLRSLAELKLANIRYAPDFDVDMRDLSQRLAPVIWPDSERKGILGELTSMRVVPSATRTASLFWLTYFVVYGLVLGADLARQILLPSATPSAFSIDFLASSPVAVTLLAAICGAHLGYTTGRLQQSIWLAMRSLALGGAALALTVQVYGATLRDRTFGSAFGDSLYRQIAIGAPIAAALIVIGPALFATLLAVSISSLVRLNDLKRLITRPPTILQILYRADDVVAAERLARGLAAYFGRKILPSTRTHAQPDSATVGEDSQTAEHIAESPRRSAATLVLVGPGWTEPGQAALGSNDRDNHLRVSIETALGLGTPIIPVLLAGATMPAPDRLPVSIRELTMINGAWVRDDPDYQGDMRRLTRVIERLTDLSEVQRLSDTLLPLLLGGALSLLVLIGADALAGLWLSATFAQQNLALEIATGAALTLIDFIVYALTSALVTRRSNHRIDGVFATMLGAALATLVEANTLHLAQGQYRATLDWLVGSSALGEQLLAHVTVYTVISVPLYVFGSLLVGALGSIYGALAYQARKRRAQERELYVMARAASQDESLGEGAVWQPRRLGGRQTQPVAPRRNGGAVPTGRAEDSTIHTEAPGGALAFGGDAAQAAGQLGRAAVGEGAVADAEASRREQLLADMLAARERTQRRAKARIAAIGGLVAAVALIAILTGGQIYRSQVGGIRTDATVVAGQVAAQTATVEALRTYFVVAPGPKCDKGDRRGTWSEVYARRSGAELDVPNNPTLQVTCLPHGLGTRLSASSEYALPAKLMLTLKEPFATAYSVETDIVFRHTGVCAAIMTNGQAAQSTGMYEYVICSDGFWQLLVFPNQSYAEPLAKGSVHLLPTNHVVALVSRNRQQFVINGRTVTTKTDSQFATTEFVAIGLDGNAGRNPYDTAGIMSADFSNFTYIPRG